MDFLQLVEVCLGCFCIELPLALGELELHWRRGRIASLQYLVEAPMGREFLLEMVLQTVRIVFRCLRYLHRLPGPKPALKICGTIFSCPIGIIVDLFEEVINGGTSG